MFQGSISEKSIIRGKIGFDADTSITQLKAKQPKSNAKTRLDGIGDKD